jgi:hypothetical protein
MKRTITAAVLTLLCVAKVPAQIDSKVESKRLMTLFNKLEGTYQVQVLNSRDKTEIPLYIMDSIETKRKQTEVVYFPLKNNVRVMVLPFSAINKKGFVPLERVANIYTEK